MSAASSPRVIKAIRVLPRSQRDGPAGLRAGDIAEIRIDHRGFVNAQKRAAVRRQVKGISSIRGNIEVAREKEADLLIAGADRDGEMRGHAAGGWRERGQ